MCAQVIYANTSFDSIAGFAFVTFVCLKKKVIKYETFHCFFIPFTFVW